MKIKCSKCSAVCNINDNNIGKTIKCSKCGEKIKILKKDKINTEKKVNIFLLVIKILFLPIIFIINLLILYSIIIFTDDIIHIFLLINIVLLLIFGFLLYFLIRKFGKTAKLIITSLLLLYSIFLVIFRFTYYDGQKVDFTYKNDKDFFTTKFENIDIKDDENLYFFLKDFQEKYSFKEHVLKPLKIDITNCLYKDECYSINLYKEKIENINGDLKLVYNKFNKEEQIFEKEEIKLVKGYLKNNIDILFIYNNEESIDKIFGDINEVLITKKYFKTYINKFEEDSILFTRLIHFYREANYKILNELINNKEDIAIEKLNNQLKLAFILLDGDGQIIDTLVAITLLQISLGNLENIINNFEITEENKALLTETLSYKINKEVLDNSLKSDTIMQVNFLNYLYSGDNINSDLIGDKEINYNKFKGTTLFDLEYALSVIKQRYYDYIKNGKMVTEEEIKLNFFRSNLLGQEISNFLVYFDSQYNKLEKIELLRSSIFDKLKQ